MAFKKGQSGNPAGRPPGSKEQVIVPIRVKRALIKELANRAIEQRDFAAQDSLLLFIVSQEAARA